MKKYLLIICNVLFILMMSGTLHALNPGDIAFVSFNADGDDDFAIVALAEIPANTVIYFTDNEANGAGGFVDTNEGFLEWITGGSPIAAGTVIVFTDTDNAANPSFGASIGTITERGGNVNLSSDGDALFAFMGPNETTPTDWLAGIENANGVKGDLTGTGLVSNSTFFTITNGPSDDGASYSGGRNTEALFEDYLSLLADVNNWNTVSSDGEILLPFSMAPFSTVPVENITQSTKHPTIQDAIDNATAGDVLEVTKGTYYENVIIDKPLTLQSVVGQSITTIQGSDNGTLGTIFIPAGVNNVTIGGQNKGFTVKGFDNDDGAVEAAAIYLQGGHENITISYNNIVANGEAGLLSEYNAEINNIVIHQNIFSGQTFTGAMPGGVGFSTQFDNSNNVPRQLVVMGGGESVSNSQNVTFTNNAITGVTGGISSDDGTSEQGNTLVTIDVLGATITGNTFAGTTARFASSLRVRGAATTVRNNVFDSSDLGELCSHAFFGDGSALTGAAVDVDDLESVLLNNEFDRAAGFDFVITPNIQGAIEEAPADSEVLVLPDEVTLEGQIVIDENRSIRGLGADKSELVFKPNQNTGSSGDARGWFLVNSGIEFNVSNLTLDGSGYLIYQAIRHLGSGTFDNIRFTAIKYNESGPDYQGVAIAASGTGNVDVRNSMFDNIGRAGVLYFGAGITGSTFSNNTYVGKGTGNFLDYALDISAGANVTATGNTISGNKGSASSDGSKSAGILVSTFFAPGTEATILNNTITDNTCGVTVGFNSSDASTVTITDNDIFDNTLLGVNSTNAQIDATNNWWGDASGPSGKGFGTGDAISGNVAFCPWLDASKDDTSVSSAFLVNNTTQGTGYCTIQEAVDNAAAGDVIELTAATFKERIVIDKSLTLQGATSDSTLYVLDGASLAGTGSGIVINSNVTDVTIQNLIVQNFAGASGNTDAGIYGQGGNDNLTVQSVAILNNVGGSGFYANGDVDNVLINNVTSEGHTIGARGIVIWNGYKSNITITNCTVRNNNCCGIELQDGTASGVTMSNNLVENNGDSGMSAIGLTAGAGPNVISNNTISNNGRFGLEIKNPNGTGSDSEDGSIVIENNTVTFTASAGMNSRDHAGIAIFRRAFLDGQGYNDIPTGVVVRNNTVTGYQQQNTGATTSEGFGIVVEGVDHTVMNNTLENNDVGLQLQGGGHPNANYTPGMSGDGDQADGQSPAYFGRGNAPYICSVTTIGNTFLNNSIATRLATSEGMFTTNSEIEAVTEKQVKLSDGSTSTTYCTIQEAVNNAASGDTIDVSAGNYDEAINIDKPLTLNGANVGVAACDGNRSAETRKLGYIRIDASEVTIDGFQFFDGANVPAGELAAIEIIGGKSDITVRNSIFERNGGSPSFDGSRGIINDFGGVTNLRVENNSFTGWQNGVYLQNADQASVTHNCFDENMAGLSADFPIAVTIEFNDFTNNQLEGIGAFDNGTLGTMLVNNNNIVGNTAGITNYANTSFEIDATSNWWGDASGPNGQGPRIGDTAVGNIDFCPWLNDEVGIGTLAPLPFVVTRDITVALDANGKATILPSQINDGSKDGCGEELSNFELDITEFDCDDVGPNTVTLTATDANDLTASATATVYVVDNAAPLVMENCPEDIYVDNELEKCEAVVNFDAPMAYDVAYVEDWEDPAFVPNTYSGWIEYNSSIARLLSGTNGIPSSAGTAHGVFNSTNLNDFSGAFSRTGGYTSVFGEGYRMQIDVYMDLTDPAVVNNTYGWDASSAVNDQDGNHRRDFIFHTASNANGEILVGGSNNTDFTRRNDLASINHYTINSTGWYTFEWDFRKAEDGSLAVDLNLYNAAGNLLWTETRNDPSDDIATIVGGNRYTWFTFLEVDELAVDNAILSRKLAVHCDIPSGSTFPVGTTTVTYSATDACDNSVTCSFDVIVRDAEQPIIDSCPTDITVNNDAEECGAIVDFAATASDNCDTDVLITYSHEPGTLFPVGTTTVTVTATDDAMNETTCTFDVTVNDAEMPAITCPDDVFLEATANCSPTLADYTDMALVADNCSGDGNLIVLQSPAPGTPLVIGSTTEVTLTAMDEAGQVNTCTFNVDILPTISIHNADVLESDAGTTSMFFNVTLSCASSEMVSVDYVTADNSATAADGDYVAIPTSTLEFMPGQTSKMIEVTINGDTKLEGDENFFVNLTTAINAGIADDRAIGLILNDDVEPTLNVIDTFIVEGNTGTSTAQVRLRLSDISSELITVNYATVNGIPPYGATTADNDFEAKQGTVVFLPGEQRKFIDITINGDLMVEADETFFINLSMVNNATIDDGQAIVTIENDDAVTTADAGEDQLDVCGTTISLNANAVNQAAAETGLWIVSSGSGGGFADATDPNTEFTGEIGVLYTLTWTITRGTALSSDNVQVQLSPDSDNDGVCDADDVCPGIDDNSEACNSDCVENRLVMQAAADSDAFLQAKQTITTNGTVTIASGKSVTFQAGESITLSPGFTAEAGSSFTARIEDCEPANSGIAGNEVDARHEEDDLPLGAKTLQLSVVPNPFSSYANLRFELPQNEMIVLRILNAVGQEIARPHNKVNFAAGKHVYFLDAQNLAAGIYYVQLMTSTEQVTQKVIVTKR